LTKGGGGKTVKNLFNNFLLCYLPRSVWEAELPPSDPK
jgi:hypothetical protein